MESLNLCPLETIPQELAIEKAAIIAGHYCVAEELEDLSHQSPAEQLSFDKGAKLLRTMKDNGKEGVLVLWVNDIGIDKVKREQLKVNYQLPENYRIILEKYSLGEDSVEVVFESSMRNKASTSLRKIAKTKSNILTKVDPRDPSLIRCINKETCEIGGPTAGHVYAVEGPDKDMLVVKEGTNPKCNLILGTFLTEVAKRHSPDAIVNIFNAIYTSRIRFGVHVANHLLDNKVDVHNFFCDEDKVMKAAWSL